MASLRPGPRSTRTWLFLVVLLGLLLGGLALWRAKTGSRKVLRVLIIAPSSGQADLDPGLETLMADHLEVLAGAAVTHLAAVPDPAILRQMPGGVLLFRFQARRENQQLALTSAWTTAAQLLAGQSWAVESLPPLDPREALDTWIQHWPLKASQRFRADLLPRSPDHFWSLLQAMSIRNDQEATDHLPASRRLVEDEPQCATAWATLGDHLYRSLWVNPEQAGIGLNSFTHKAFQRAVALVPGHPRATFLWSLMLTDTGNQSLALGVLREAVLLRPNTPDLYQGFAYAGRTAGLLAGASSALAQRKALLSPLGGASAWTVGTTNLYLGNWTTFEQELQEARAVRTEPDILFYQGYLALLKGDRQGALLHMKAGSELKGAGPFQNLCGVYRALLEGRTEQGLAQLRLIDDIRGKVRIPDGELTFKQAEAYALLGDADRAMDCATRAFVQGFSCARWFENSPFLERMRTHPRWPMLRRNIRERQAVLEGSFPVSAFGP
ncbi:hypothetical protein GETHOR_09470 [Geothrix oryzae]|uniref:Tetratricopeptide repeat-containing protein n=1 Tax=Geothrix oryzae TaxID=2927975 RepID=A0ABN6UVQ4_9BACT|nr:hypothetical protein GETHOR_09470 [Geothrix oryzae]